MTQARDEVGKSIEAIEQSGLRVEHKDKDHDDYYEIKIRIYKIVRKNELMQYIVALTRFIESIYF